MRGKKHSGSHSRRTRYVPVAHRLTEEEFELWYSEPCLSIWD